MRARLLTTLVSTVSLTAMLVYASAVPSPSSARGANQPPPPPENNVGQQEGVEVLARGPVHEAFAEPSIRGPRPTPVVPKKPPEAIEELPPDQKPQGNNIQWIPGYWAWDDDRNDFLWVSGIWRDIPPGQQWVPGHWEATEEGNQWVSGYWTSLEQATAEFLPQPPNPIEESIAPAPSANQLYVPGTWVWRNRYLWRPGFYVGYRPGWVWIPAHYVWTPAGYLSVDGYWDYPLANRGLLFAPVAIAPGFWGRPAWFYRPFYTVSDSFLLGALFLRPTYGHYYFGDYFDPRWGRLGFTSWVDFRVGNQFYDPLLSYYRWHNRDNPNWVRDLRQVYVARRNGDLPRPPLTLVQQNINIQNNRGTTINNIRNTSITNITNITNITALSSLTQVKQQGVNLQRVSTEQMARDRKDVQRFRTLAQERVKVEAQVKAQGSPLAGGTELRAPVRMNLPGLKVVARPAATVNAPPPVPTLPTPKLQPAVTDRVVKPLDTLGRPPRVEGGRLMPEKGITGQPLGGTIPSGKPTEFRKDTGKPLDEIKKPLGPTGPIKPLTPAPEIKKLPPPELKKPPPAAAVIKPPPPPPPKPAEVKKTPPPDPKPAPKPVNKDKPKDN